MRAATRRDETCVRNTQPLADVAIDVEQLLPQQQLHELIVLPSRRALERILTMLVTLSAVSPNV